MPTINTSENATIVTTKSVVALGTRYILDEIPGGNFGFATHRLREGYTGPILRIRESGGNTEADIGSLWDGSLDEAAIYAHCGANNGFVTASYDQTTGAVMAVQATTSKQPQIYTSGQLNRAPVTTTGSFRPSMFFAGTDDCLQVASITLPAFQTVSFLGRVTTRGVLMEQSNDAINNDGFYFAGINNPVWLVRRTASHFALGTANWFDTGAMNVGTFTYDGSGAYYENGTVQANSTITGTARANTNATTTLNLMARNNGASGATLAYAYEFLGFAGTASFSTLYQYLQSYGAGSKVQPIIILGDSTVGTYAPGPYNPVATYLQTSYGATLYNITDVATSGETIAQQRTRYEALSTSVKHAARTVIIQVGLNDMDYTEAASVALSRYQTLVNSVKATSPYARIYTCTMIPAKQRWIDLYGPVNGLVAQQKWVDMNEGYIGDGANAITGMFGSITAQTAALDDGNGNLNPTYNPLGDGIHEDNPGRILVAAAWRDQLVKDGTIP